MSLAHEPTRPTPQTEQLDHLTNTLGDIREDALIGQDLARQIRDMIDPPSHPGARRNRLKQALYVLGGGVSVLAFVVVLPTSSPPRVILSRAAAAFQRDVEHQLQEPTGSPAALEMGGEPAFTPQPAAVTATSGPIAVSPSAAVRSSEQPQATATPAPVTTSQPAPSAPAPSVPAASAASSPLLPAAVVPIPSAPLPTAAPGLQPSIPDALPVPDPSPTTAAPEAPSPSPTVAVP